jgi:uncharacterized membrane protein YcgQ (UPF0703/DUF1980 family)
LTNTKEEILGAWVYVIRYHHYIACSFFSFILLCSRSMPVAISTYYVYGIATSLFLLLFLHLRKFFYVIWIICFVFSHLNKQNGADLTIAFATSFQLNELVKHKFNSIKNKIFCQKYSRCTCIICLINLKK